MRPALSSNTISFMFHYLGPVFINNYGSLKICNERRLDSEVWMYEKESLSLLIVR